MQFADYGKEYYLHFNYTSCFLHSGKKRLTLEAQSLIEVYATTLTCLYFYVQLKVQIEIKQGIPFRYLQLF